MRWARMTPERIDALAALEPRQAALALRALLAHPAALACCAHCQARFEVHGDLASLEHTACPVCAHTDLRLAS